ncbi:MAG: DUF4835 family protein [Cytophagales bacterium]|nr:DUF4835 family protein [Cytophagales bacterium]
MKLTTIISIICLFGLSAGYSQELNCKVLIDHRQITISDPSIFDAMETDIAEFLNNRKWTNDDFQDDERINCNFLITVSSMPSIGVFEATVQVLSSRPIYGTEYETVLLNFADRDWSFPYVQSKPMQFNENSFKDNLSSLLAYYAYIILGMDYDSFSELGGGEFFQEAFKIVNNALQSNYPGWQQLGSNRNRYWLVENLQNASLQPIRSAMYSYHRLGLDVFREEPDEARNVIAKALQNIQLANRARPRSILTISFMDAKATELANIYSAGSPTVRKKAYNILTSIDPSKTDTFKPMIE